MPDLLTAWPLTSWLLTYLLHGTLLLAAAWLVTLLWRRMPVAWNETLWRTAMLGGVLTASLQLALDVEPAGGRVAVAVAVSPAPLGAAPETPDAAPVETVWIERPALEPSAVAPPAPPVLPAATEPMPQPASPLPWIAGVWALGVAVGLVRLARAHARLRTRLAHREPCTEGALRARLDALAARAGLRRRIGLSTVAGIGSPLAVGILRPEIVVPTRAVATLSATQLDAMLAHELAHHIRRDALWQTLLRLLATCFFFQPLHVVARRRLHETAELLSDAWAVEQTGCSRSLAECLTVVAGWRVTGHGAAPVPAMAARGSMLARRVERLLEHRHASASAASRGRLGACALAVLPLLTVVVAAPSVATGAADVLPTHDAVRELPLRLLPAPPTDAGDASALDAEIERLEGEVATLLDLLARVSEPPPALVAGAARLRARLQSLTSKRAALRAAPDLEMPR